MERKNAWKFYTEETAAVEELGTRYRRFLNRGKTERECIAEAVRMARRSGYRDIQEMVQTRTALKPGDQVYLTHMEKAAVFFHIGKEPLEQGIHIIGAHVDSPRLDVKQVPCYEEKEQVYLDTHYYGGVKKYQWLALPLALHGVIVRPDGKTVEVQIGEEEKDPVFTITDLLPHLGKEQQEKKVREFINAEKMDLLIGNRPAEEKTPKEYILQLLWEKYQIREADFLSAELEIVPAGKARECGLDRSMILAYGQDDRSCAFASLEALFGLKGTEEERRNDGCGNTAERFGYVKRHERQWIPDRTACCLLVDKEEIGSNGATGMKSRFFENAVAEILYLSRDEKTSVHEAALKNESEGGWRKKESFPVPLDLKVRRTLMNSQMLSADVSAAFDPMFDTYFEKKNSAYLANGLVFNKYSGSGGKAGANDANPEFMAELRRIMEENHVRFQTAELGAVDQGGGGTIAYIMAEYGMDVIDCGIAVLSMHAPWEVTSKADLYEAVKGYSAFFRK